VAVISSGRRCVWHLFVALFDNLTAIRCMHAVLRNMQPRLHILRRPMVWATVSTRRRCFAERGVWCLIWIVGGSWACWEPGSEEQF
jgi:hypothetical protein